MRKRKIPPGYLLNNFFLQFVHIFLALLLCKTNLLNILNMVDFFSDFYIIGKYLNFLLSLILG